MNKRFLLFFMTLAMLFASLASGKSAPKSSRMNRNQLNIGTYYLQPYANTETHVKDLADCGIDFVVCMKNNREVLDLFQKYGVGAIVTGILPTWWGGDGKNAGTMAQTIPLSRYEEAAKKFQDHPAIWGIDLGDEPSALDFPYYGKVFKKFDELFPNQFAYLNLYPNYASVSQNTDKQTVNQLGTPTYAQHIAAYCEHVPTDYICYDFYLYSIDVPRAYKNLLTVSDACRATNRSMWIVLQVNSNKPEEWISTNELRFQAYTAMAFGTEVITWACYTAGWWHNQVLDEKGQKTQQYDKLREVNKEIHLLGKTYMKYQRTSTAFVGFYGTPWLKDIDQPTVPFFSNYAVSNLCTTDGSPLVIGDMTSRKGRNGSAVFVCAADDPYDKDPKTHNLRFRSNGRRITIHGTNGLLQPTVDSEGFYIIPIQSNSAIIIETK